MTRFTPPLSRRTLLKSAAAGTALAAMAGPLSAPALAANRPVKFTLAWLAQGTTLYVYLAKAKGFFSQRGLDVEISRGYGSLPAAQSIAAGQFDYGIVISTPLILSIAKGLPLKAIATVDYDATMGMGVLQDSPITAAKDLTGKKIGAVPGSAEYPFFPAFMQKAGMQMSDVELVHLDNKVLERAMTEKQVAAIMGIGSSSLPVMLSKGIPVRWLLYSSVGMRTYGQTIVTRPEVLERDPAVSEAVVDALMEAVAYSMKNPEESMEIFAREVPEIALTQNGKEFVRIGLGLAHHTIARSEAMEHGLGWGDPAVYQEMIDLVMTYAGGEGMTRPTVEQVFTNDFAGEFKLEQPEWQSVQARSAEFGKLVS
ncbi:ABC transporter substrate-binding protein (plasmid) [Skermanella sp. TT6]|uniref:Thiamine pyrimidine synthase n=1 Tax=Skermanella cutis TaxID=2775420 RepID=A0ABX7BK02_9PROT|nr:ABC transporter substrate-binding protein [Skermanella sp. TT6]QQP92807.1 ABC transporter substrate-binding protein [Skermanella sp. TT6]